MNLKIKKVLVMMLLAAALHTSFVYVCTHLYSHTSTYVDSTYVNRALKVDRNLHFNHYFVLSFRA